MAISAQELNRSIETGSQQQPQTEPKLEERPVNPDLGRIEEDRQELANYINPVSDEETPGDVEHDGQTVLQGFRPVGELSLSDEVVKNERLKWYHVHKHIGNALTWLVEQFLRKEKKEAREGE